MKEATERLSKDELVDETILQQMIKDTSADIIPMLIEHYIDESQQRLANIEQAVLTHNLEQLEFEVHTLGSSALALGNRALSRLARDIEKLCLDGDNQQAIAKCDELPTLAQRSFSALVDRKNMGF
ncbi:Hpt domain-containing protein [Vibrio rotiferianus]|uniref:Phosphorelay protein LuxU n=1 Tax=Vibrio rotiferianus TaxID=190895 RepID=A0ABX3DCZ7_9VIBR|nr:Hpt domain-containing protein [Vibrio rotiferianus]ASI96501.1 phosphorelay protein LuxU [Vibrio rotiferianus]OHY95571.1 phosphorelay protein LuxU [Vibrio rotiferianus]